MKMVLLLLVALWSIPALPNQASASEGKVAVRNVFESMGAQVTWNENRKAIAIQRGENQILLKVGSSIAYKDGKKWTLSRPIQLNARTDLAEISTRDVYFLAKTNEERHYRVQSNDSLWMIAQRFHVTVEELIDWNQLTIPTVYPGQHLHVTNPYYVVRDGDTLSDIADQTESTVDQIKKANGLKSDTLQPGQKLWIPPQASIQPPHWFKGAVFPMINETYSVYQNDFGNSRSFSTNGQERNHEGIDIYAKKWVPVFSVDHGRVVRMGWNTYGGWRLSIESENGIAFYYAHLAGYANGISKGGWVNKGQLIGYVGATGYGPEGTTDRFESHLHFGMYDTQSPRWKSLNSYWLLRWWETQ